MNPGVFRGHFLYFRAKKIVFSIFFSSFGTSSSLPPLFRCSPLARAASLSFHPEPGHPPPFRTAQRPFRTVTGGERRMYQSDVAALTLFGFDAVKLDGCGRQMEPRPRGKGQEDGGAEPVIFFDS